MSISHFYMNILKTCLFIFEKECGEGQRERGRERILSRLCAVSAELDVRLELMNREIMTWAKTKRQMLNQLSHPGALRERILTRLHAQHGDTWGSIPWPWDHDLSWNRELDAWPTKPPRRSLLDLSWWTWRLSLSWNPCLSVLCSSREGGSERYYTVGV